MEPLPDSNTIKKKVPNRIASQKHIFGPVGLRSNAAKLEYRVDAVLGI